MIVFNIYKLDLQSIGTSPGFDGYVFRDEVGLGHGLVKLFQFFRYLKVSRVDVEVLLLLVTELLDPVSELLALGDDARDVGEVGHTVQALHPDVARGGADPLVDAVHIMPVTSSW